MAAGGGSPAGEEECRKAAVARFKDKRVVRRPIGRRVRYEARRVNADKRPRIKGRFVSRVVSFVFSPKYAFSPCYSHFVSVIAFAYRPGWVFLPCAVPCLCCTRMGVDLRCCRCLRSSSLPGSSAAPTPPPPIHPCCSVFLMQELEALVTQGLYPAPSDHEVPCCH